MPAMTLRTSKKSAGRPGCCASDAKHFSRRSRLVSGIRKRRWQNPNGGVSSADRAPAAIYRAAISMSFIAADRPYSTSNQSLQACRAKPSRNPARG
jgi:hypothetical protein